MTQRTRDHAKEYGRVAVLMGGWSDEREVSLASGAEVLAALLRSGVDAVGIDLTPDIARRMDWSAYDRAFIVLHGLGGEDGTIQGCLEIAGLPYTGSGVLGSALGMDKLACKRIWAGMRLPIPPYRIMAKDSSPEAVAEALGMPLAVKPARGGSSLALTRVTHIDQIPGAYARAAAQGKGAVLAEQWIQGREFTVGILGNEPLPVIEIQPPGEFYDYEAKYHSDATRYLCPPSLSLAEQLEIQSLAISAFASIDADGWGRVDLLRDGHGDLYLVEVNTVPGMTSHSLVPKAAAQAGIDFERLCLRILDTSTFSTREVGR